YRLMDRGVDLIFNPSASHFAMGKSKLREDLVMESSQKLHACYFYTNLLGNEAGRMIFDGEILLAKQGKLILKNPLLSFKNYKLLTFDLEKSNKANYPLVDEKESVHAKYEEFTKAITLGLFDYLRKTRSKGFVLSL